MGLFPKVFVLYIRMHSLTHLGLATTGEVIIYKATSNKVMILSITLLLTCKLCKLAVPAGIEWVPSQIVHQEVQHKAL